MFGSGLTIGRVTAPATPRAPTSQAVSVAIDEKPDVWAARAAERLSADLKLAPAVRDQLHATLVPVANEMFSDRERALFQMHLRLLSAHDQIASKVDLDDSQRQRLSQSRNRLKSLIIRNFPRMVSGHPTLAVESNPLR